MQVRTVAACLFSCLAIVSGTRAAYAALDVVPAPGGTPIRLHVTQTFTGPDGPRTTTTDFEVRRTGAAAAALARNSDIDPLTVDAQGALHPANAASSPPEPELAQLLDALNVAHGVLGVTGAGDQPGWSAEIPMPERSVASSQQPGPPLTLPMQAVAANGGVNIDGAVETTLAGSEQPRQPRSRGGGGGFGGRGGFGGGRGGGGGGEGGGGGPPVILDVHVTGRITGGSLTRLTITQTRRIVIDGMTYTNVASSTFDAR